MKNVSLVNWHQVLRDLELHTAMIEHGWRFWPANATENEKKAAITEYLDGAQPTWYPPDYVEPPIDASGKLKEEEGRVKMSSRAHIRHDSRKDNNDHGLVEQGKRDGGRNC